MDRFGIIMRDIPGDYGFTFPLRTMAEVDMFAQTLHLNNLKDEYEQPRNRMLELV
jgi:hypothetical protein